MGGDAHVSTTLTSFTIVGSPNHVTIRSLPATHSMNTIASPFMRHVTVEVNGADNDLTLKVCEYLSPTIHPSSQMDSIL
jgi:hypothetical protein